MVIHVAANIVVKIPAIVGVLCCIKISPKGTILSWAWRIPFLLGGLLGVVGVYIRGKLTESPEFQEIEKHNQQAKFPFAEILMHHKTPTIAGIFTTMFAATCITTFYMYLPSYLIKFYSMSYFKVLSYNTFGLFVFIVSIVLWAIVADKKGINPKSIFRFSAVVIIFISIPFFTLLKYDNPLHLIAMYIVLGIGLAPALSFFVVLMTKSFPAKVRFTGVAIAYNVSFAIFAGLTPLINTVLIKELSTPIAPAYYAILAAGIGLIATFAVKFIKEED